MAMVVNHNIAAQLTLVELNKNSNKLKKSLEKVSSGQKISSAQDDASGYVISEKMREQVRALAQDNQNVQNGSSLFKIAEGGINSIVEELRNLKELAINAANDTNTDVDRVTIQKEFQQKYANINDIATTTNYNGKPLLDGTYFRKHLDNTTIKKVVITQNEPTGTPIILSGATNVTISSGGVYSFASDYTGTVTIAAGVTDVKFTQENSSVPLNDVYIVGSSTGNANLWIDGLNINNSQDGSTIQFQGSGNYLTIKGKNTFVNNNNSMTNAMIEIGTSLTIEGSGVLNAAVTNSRARGPVIGHRYLTAVYSSVDTININSGTFNLVNKGFGAGIGSGFNDSNVFSPRTDGVGISGQGDNFNITIAGGTFDITIGKNEGGEPGTAIGSGRCATIGNIVIGNDVSITASVDSTADGGSKADPNYASPAIGAAGARYFGLHVASYCGDITISNKAELNLTSDNSVNIGVGDGSEAGYGSICGIISYVDDLDLLGGLPIKEEIETTDSTDIIYNALKIHHGPKANQATNFFINDMHTKSLGTKKLFSDDESLSDWERILNEQDQARYEALSYDENLQSAWVETLKSAQNKTLDDISVTTQKNANVAIRVIDGAIEYAVNEATEIGAYLQRLDYTDANITTMGENVQSAESTIRDADMAKEMTEYTKNNVLLQASQSMLAQANQNSSAVLSLLQ